MDRRLKIALWNANGVATRKNELHVFAVDHDLDVILLNETRLQGDAVFNVPGYQTYRTDRQRQGQRRGNPGGGTAVLVHRRLAHRPVNTGTAFESTGIATLVGGSEIFIYAAYVSPGVAAAFRPADLDPLLDSADSVIIGGDLNAKHQSWNSRRPTPRGTQLRTHLDQRRDTTVEAPVTPTYYPPQVNMLSDVLDIFLLKDVNFQVECNAVDDLSSDHVPVLLTVNANAAVLEPRTTSTMRTDWRKYNEHLQDLLVEPQRAETTDALDRQVAEIHATLTEALEAATRPCNATTTRSALPAHILAAIQRKKRLRRIWQRARHPITRAMFNRQCNVVKRLLYDYRSETWDAYLTSLDTTDGSAWKLAKILRSEKHTNRPLHGQQGMVYSAQDKAEAFADTMEEQFRTHPNIYDEDHIEEVEEELNEFFAAAPGDQVEPFTLDEVTEAVKRSRPRKAPGLDRVSNKAIQYAPPHILLVLLSVFNSALRLCHFPSTWKSAKIVLFPKPGKDRLFPQNYRPISLLPTISKIFERLFLSRVSPLLDGYIRPEQFGFRRGHSTTQQLVRVVNMLVDNANMNLCSTGVLLDVSKAFDKVWHEGLLYKLAMSPLPPAAVHLLRSYLRGRSFQISVDGALSTERAVEAGVPQGSVLGPTLYLVYTNDMPTAPGVTLSLYADDAMFLCRSARPELARNTMQRQMQLLEPWLEKWRIAVNTDKSVAVLFRKRRRMPRAQPQPVHLNGDDIEWKDKTKYLGVTLDSKLNFAPHAKKKLAEAKQIMGMLNPMLGRRSTLPVRTRTTLFLLIVRSVIMYASTAWWAICAASHKKKFDVIQSKAFRQFSKQPWFVSNKTIRDSLQVPSLDEFARSSAERFFRKAAESTQQHIAQIAVRHNLPEDYRPRPVAILDLPP